MATQNRIRELRIAREMSTEQLAERVGTSQVQISRLERGERKLTVEWMMRIADALDCAPEDLLDALTVAGFSEQAAPYEFGEAGVEQALAAQNKFLYCTKSTALSALGIGADDPLLFDMSADAVRTMRTGDIVIVQIMDRDDTLLAKTIVRQYIAPDLLTTNRPGRNTSFHMTSEPNFTAQIRGVHRLEHPQRESEPN